MAKELGVGTLTLRDILAQLARPGRDPREDLPAAGLQTGRAQAGRPCTPGMELTGTVLNVVDFGCFVDIGMHDSGLVHVSHLADRFIRDPHEVVAVGDIVKVWVLAVDKERRRVSLTMVRPGSERPRRPIQGEPSADGAPADSREGDRGGRRPRRSPASQTAGCAAGTSRRAAGVSLRAPGPAARASRRADRSTALPPPTATRPAIFQTAAAVARPGQAAAAEAAPETFRADHRRDEGRQGADADFRRPVAVLRAQAAGCRSRIHRAAR